MQLSMKTRKKRRKSKLIWCGRYPEKNTGGPPGAFYALPTAYKKTDKISSFTLLKVAENGQICSLLPRDGVHAGVFFSS